MYQKYTKRNSIVMRIILATCFVIFSFAMSYGQVCNSELKVYKDRNFKAANQNGAEFWMELTNKSATPTSFTITTKNLETSCSNETLRTSAKNVKLDAVVLQQDSNKLVFS